MPRLLLWCWLAAPLSFGLTDLDEYTSIPQAARAGGIIINEVQFAPSPATAEYIELYNRSSEPADLASFTLADARSEPLPITSSSLMVQPQEYLVIVRDSAAFRLSFPSVPIHQPAKWPALNNSGDDVTLRRGDAVMDHLAYDGAWGTPGKALERVDPNGPTQAAFNWKPSRDPSGGTPGRQNSQFAPDVVPPSIILAELSRDQTLAVFWDEPVDTSALSANHFHLSPGEIHSINWASQQEALLRVQDVRDDASLEARNIQDLTGNSRASFRIPIAHTPARSDLLINEIMYDPLADPSDGRPDQPEYIELINQSPRLLSLRTITLSSLPDEHGRITTHEPAPNFLIVQPHGFIVMTAQTAAALQAAFPNLDTLQVSILPTNTSAIGLNNSEDAFQILADEQLAAIAYTPTWHHPALIETKGISLERKPDASSIRLSDSWTSSADPAGGTPGRPNSIATTDTSINPEQVTLSPAVISPNGDGFDDELILRWRLPAGGHTLQARVFDDEGRHIRWLTQGQYVGPEGLLHWNGLADNNRFAPTGLYVVHAEFVDVGGREVYAVKRAVGVVR